MAAVVAAPIAMDRSACGRLCVRVRSVSSRQGVEPSSAGVAACLLAGTRNGPGPEEGPARQREENHGRVPGRREDQEGTRDRGRRDRGRSHERERWGQRLGPFGSTLATAVVYPYEPVPEAVCARKIRPSVARRHSSQRLGAGGDCPSPGLLSSTRDRGCLGGCSRLACGPEGLTRRASPRCDSCVSAQRMPRTFVRPAVGCATTCCGMTRQDHNL
jgi:hypothetical protein